jgi:hypothetical protein
MGKNCHDSATFENGKNFENAKQKMDFMFNSSLRLLQLA